MSFLFIRFVELLGRFPLGLDSSPVFDRLVTNFLALFREHRLFRITLQASQLWLRQFFRTLLLNLQSLRGLGVESIKHSILGALPSEVFVEEFAIGFGSGLQEIRVVCVESTVDETVSPGLIGDAFDKRFFNELCSKSQNGLLGPSKFSGTGITASNDSIFIVEIISESELSSELFRAKGVNFLFVLFVEFLGRFPLGLGSRRVFDLLVATFREHRLFRLTVLALQLLLPVLELKLLVRPFFCTLLLL